MTSQSLALASLIAITATAWALDDAQAGTRHIDRREVRQEQRIDQGRASGQLNAREAARLDARHDKLENDVAAAKADGKVTHRERVQLRAEERRQSRAIHRQKHDAQ